MTELGSDNAAIEEAAVSSVYKRIGRATTVLNAIAMLVAGVFFGWQVAFGVLLGAVTAYVNMRWLHHGTQLLVDRMATAGKAAKGALMLAFIGRLGFVLAASYVIFVSSQRAFYGFLVALFLPIAGAVCEAAYEALGA